MFKNKSLHITSLMIAILTACVFFSCSQEEPLPTSHAMGYMSVSLDAFTVTKNSSNSSSSGRVAADFTANLTLSDFGMIIYQKGTSNIIRQFAVGQIPTDSVPLMDGDYTAVLDNHKGNDITVGHYSGSQDFTIVPRQATNVDVTTTLQEVYFTFTLLENFYTTHEITVQNDSGMVVVADASAPYTELFLPTLPAPESYVFSVVNLSSGNTIGTSNVAANTNGQGYNMQVNDLAGDGSFSVTIAPINVDDTGFTLTPTEIFGFNGDFAGSNWTSTNNGSATSYNFGDSTLTFDCPGGGGGFVSQITIPGDGTISFDWNMVIRTAGQYGDRFSYSINGTRVDLTTNGGSGTVTDLAVNQGDVFAILPWGTTQSSSYYGSVTNFVFVY